MLAWFILLVLPDGWEMVRDSRADQAGKGQGEQATDEAGSTGAGINCRPGGFGGRLHIGMLRLRRCGKM